MSFVQNMPFLQLDQVVELLPNEKESFIRKDLFPQALESSGYIGDQRNIDSLVNYLVDSGCGRFSRQDPLTGQLGTCFNSCRFVNNTLNPGFRKGVPNLSRIIGQTSDETKTISLEDIVIQLERIGHLADPHNIKSIEVYIKSLLGVKFCYVNIILKQFIRCLRNG